MVDNYLAASQLGKYPRLATSSSVNNCYLVSNCNLILNRSDKLIVKKTHFILQTNVFAWQIGHETRNPQRPAACKPEPEAWINHEEVGNTS